MGPYHCHLDIWEIEWHIHNHKSCVSLPVRNIICLAFDMCTALLTHNLVHYVTHSYGSMKGLVTYEASVCTSLSYTSVSSDGLCLGDHSHAP